MKFGQIIRKFSAYQQHHKSLQVSSGSMGRGLGSQDHLAGLPRNFSLSDLGLDHVMDGEHGGILPRNISLSDFPALDLDSGGEQN